MVVAAIGGTNTLLAFDLSGEAMRGVGIDQEHSPVRNNGPIAFGRDGILLIVDASHASIKRLDRAGSELPALHSTTAPMAGLASLSDGGLIVTERESNSITHYRSDGSRAGQWGGTGKADAEFDGVGGVATDSDGNIYVVDTGNNRVQKFDRDGRYQMEIGASGRKNKLLDKPLDISIDVNDVLYIVDAKQRVATFDTSGRFTGQFGDPASGAGSLVEPVAVAVDNCGSVWIADTGAAVLVKYSTHGYFRTAVPLEMEQGAGVYLATIHEQGACSNDGA